MKQDLKRCPKCKRLINAARAYGIHTCETPRDEAVSTDPISPPVVLDMSSEVSATPVESAPEVDEPTVVDDAARVETAQIEPGNGGFGGGGVSGDYSSVDTSSSSVDTSSGGFSID